MFYALSKRHSGQPTDHPTGHGPQFAGNQHGLFACRKLERAESVGVELGWEFPAERKPGERTSCRTCTSVPQKCIITPGVNCPDTFKTESITPETWVQGLFLSGSAEPAICGVRSQLGAEIGVRNAECQIVQHPVGLCRAYSA